MALKFYDGTGQQDYRTIQFNAPSDEVTNGLQDLVNSFNTAYNQAKAHNEQLYNQMIGINQDYLNKISSSSYDTSGLFNQALAAVRNMTGQREADIRSDAERTMAKNRQALARTGMANTTVGASLNQGTEREKQNSLNRLADEMATLMAGIYQNKASAKLAGTTAQNSAYGNAYQTMLNVMGNYGADALPDLSSVQNTIMNVMAQYGGGQALAPGLNVMNKLRLA